MRHERAAEHFRTVLISDLHLGSHRCDARSVLAFLESHRAQTLYLVGDVIDLWSLRRHTAWLGRESGADRAWLLDTADAADDGRDV